MTRIDVGFILRLAVLHALALAALALPAHAADWEDYQYETFDSTDTIFPTGTFGEASYSVDSQGRYIVNGMESSVDSLAAINDSNSFYRVSGDCQILSSTAGELAFCGLIFHYGKRPGDDKVSYYVFYVYGDGFYGVKRIIDGGKSDVIIPLAQTTLLSAGEANTLAVEARGNNFDLFINGQPVNKFTDMKIDGGGYGLYISKHAIGAFDNFEVKLQPAPVKPQEDVRRSEGQGGIKPLNIPRNPDRPLYPWEVGYDKDPKKKKRKLREQERSAAESRSVDEPKKPAPKKTEGKSTAPKPAEDKSASKVKKGSKAKPTDELTRDVSSRSDKGKGFIADAEPVKHKPPVETPQGASLRDQYKEAHGEEPHEAESPKAEPAPAEPEVQSEAPVTVEPATQPPTEVPESTDSEPATGSAAPLDSAAGVELEDKTVTDTGAVLPGTTADGDVLYRRDPKYTEEKPEKGKQQSKPEPQATKEATKAAEPDKPKHKRGGIDTSGDDWDIGARTTYEPKKRVPKAKPQSQPKAEPAPEPKEATASNGEKVKVETLPLDGTPLSDTELEQEQPLDTSTSLEDKPDESVALHIDGTQPAAEPEPTPEAARETAESPLPSLDLPELPSEPKPEPIHKPTPSGKLKPLSRPGQVEISDDFTSQQRWNSQELPTSSYKYTDGAYAIDNTKAQTMAISYQQDTFSDSDIAVEAKHTSGADYVGYGLASRFSVGKDATGRTVISYYGLFISLSGEFMILKVVDGQETVLRDWGLSPLVKLGDVNRVELRVEGDQITALINGSVAAQVSDGELKSGGYALLAGPGIAAQYDNLSLSGVRE